MSFLPEKNSWPILTLLLLTLGVMAGAVLISRLPPLQDLEKKIRDQYFMIRGPLDVRESPIIIVELSQEADEEIPFRFPWPRHVYAKLIENLNEAGARVIGIDLLFDQEDENPANDSLLVETLETYQNVVLIGGFRRSAETTPSGVVSERTTRVMPVRILEKAMSNPPGIVTMHRDSDGFIREYPTGSEFSGEKLHSLALQMLRTAYGPGHTFSEDANTIRINHHVIPKNVNGFMYLNYYGANRTFPHIGFEKIIDDEDFDTRMEMLAFPVNEFSDPDYGILSSGILEDKIVLVGATMPELQDYHPVPFASSQGETVMSGVEIHAHALQTILDHNFLKDVDPAAGWICLFLLLLFLAWSLHRLNVYQGVAVTVLVLAGVVAGGYILFSGYGLIMKILPVLTGTAGMFITITTGNYLAEQKEKQRITSMFSSYVSPDLVSRLIDGKEDFKLAGENKNLTVLFSDIANFSKLAEKMPAEKLVSFMNEYLGEMTDIINREKGTLDKYIGDAVMAFFGAPVSLPGHALHACRAALLMQKASAKLYTSGFFDDFSDVPFYTRIGINTGSVVVGNMGSGRRFNYTVMGDNVNIGSRCEAACKEFGIPVIVTGATKKNAGSDEILFRYLGKLRVIGKQQAVDIYQPVAFSKEAEDTTTEWVRNFEKAVAFYFNREWKMAEQLFKQTQKKESDVNGVPGSQVNPSTLYINLCRLHAETPAPAGWDGVIEQRVK